MKVAVLLSGGVDSSVALALLKEQAKKKPHHLKLTAFYLKVWLQDELTHLGNCPWEEDIAYAQKVCRQLKIPLKIISLQEAYWNRVVKYAIEEIKSGRTPNPDILCNSLIKFGEFIDQIGRNYDYVASGHYARIENNGSPILKMTPDLIKDQTYFLAYLKKEQLKKCLFPLGNLRNSNQVNGKEASQIEPLPQTLTKNQVRVLAQKYNLATQARKDSQGVCFLGKIKFKDFIKFHLGEKEGKIIEFNTKKLLGTHQGYWFYTLGQRQGLQLSGGPWYVIDKDIEKNLIYVGHAESFRRNIFFNHDVDLKNKIMKIKVEKMNWLEKYSFEKINQKNRWNKNNSVKLRHGPSRYPFRLIKIDFNQDQLIMEITYPKQLDIGIATGQFAVFYEKDVCLGAGIITR